jgi:hypothetical protein
MRKFHRSAGAAGVLVVAALTVAGCGSSSSSSGSNGTASTAATSGTTTSSTAAGIPKKTVKLGFYPCCADSALPIVGIEQGFFKDVGITLDPPNGDQFTQAPQFLPAMKSKRDDASTAFSTTWLNTLNTYGQSLPPAMLYDIYLGRDILMAPGTQLKSTGQFMAEGMPFTQAAAKAVQQIKGQTVYTDPYSGAQPPYYNVLLSFGGLTSKDINFRFLTDDKILALSATPSRVPFAVPLNAPVLVKMIRNGYKPLIDMPTTLKNAPTSPQAVELLKETGNQTLMIQRSMWDTDPDLVLRLVSVMFRSIAFLQNPATASTGNTEIARAINANQGLELDGQDIALVYKDVDPLFNWEQQKSTLWNPSSPYFAPKGLAEAVRALIGSRALPAGNYDLEKFLLAKQVFTKLAALQAQADQLFKKASSLTGSKQALVTQAHTYYNYYDFLDAVDLLKKAMA